MKSASLILLMIPTLLAATAVAAEEASFVTYRSHDPALPITFDYPADWKVMSRPSGGQAPGLQVIAPPSPRIHGLIILTVSVQPLKAAGGQYASAKELVEFYKSHMPPSSEPGEATVLGVTAVKLSMRSQARSPSRTIPSELVPKKGERVIFEKDDQLYELTWTAPDEAVPQAAAAFEHLLRTLALIDDSAPAPAAP